MSPRAPLPKRVACTADRVTTSAQSTASYTAASLIIALKSCYQKSPKYQKISYFSNFGIVHRCTGFLSGDESTTKSHVWCTSRCVVSHRQSSILISWWHASSSPTVAADQQQLLPRRVSSHVRRSNPLATGVPLLPVRRCETIQPPGLLMRPIHTETKAKTETRECKTETETETETKNYETETCLVNSVACESKTNRYAFVIDYIFDIINDE